MSRLNLLIDGYPALRDEVWQSALALFREKPMFGYGLETRGILAEHHHVYSEHNIFLSVLLALGAAGFAAYIYLLSSICSRAVKDQNGIGLSLMALLMGVGMFGFDFYRDQHFMICFIITIFFIIRSPDDFTQPSHK
jgi:O-antigen ligase